MKPQVGARSAASAQDDDCLLQAIAAQDQTALHMLYDRYAASVHAFVSRRIDSAHVADEVTNDTFVEIWRGAGKFEHRSSVKTWMLGIAKHKVMDAMRSRYRLADIEQANEGERLDEVPDQSPGPYEQALGRQRGAHLVECFDALPPDHRECLHLSIVEGMTLNEIAKVVNVPSNTVGTRIHHAKHKLKACLETRLGAGEVV